MGSNNTITMHGERAERRSKSGKEWWGKRPLSNTPVSKNSKVMKKWKRLLHKRERVINNNFE